MGITQKIEVSVGYNDFNFDDVDQAIAFAKMAAMTNKDHKKTMVTIVFDQDEKPEVIQEEAEEKEEESEDE